MGRVSGGATMEGSGCQRLLGAIPNSRNSRHRMGSPQRADLSLHSVTSPGRDQDRDFWDKDGYGTPNGPLVAVQIRNRTFALSTTSDGTQIWLSRTRWSGKAALTSPSGRYRSPNPARAGCRWTSPTRESAAATSISPLVSMCAPNPASPRPRVRRPPGRTVRRSARGSSR